MYRIVFISILLILITACPILAGEKEDLFILAETYYASRESTGSAEAAVNALEKVLVIEPQNYVALWKLSQYYKWLGDKAPDENKLDYFEKGKFYAEEAEMETCIKIDPTYDEAHYVLGVLYRKAPGWPLSCGDIKKSKGELLLAIKYNPNRLLSHLGLAETYTNTGDYNEAREELNKVISMPFEPDRTPEDKEYKAQAAQILKDIEEK
ncbi:MAG: hypothetical protein NT030_00765 [Candidatus Saganbacteria bacterium]|nr:hypothetical protein [Candidatus Saganbacteria bacterium]